MTKVLVLADTLNNYGFKLTESDGVFTCSDAGGHAFLKRFPSDPPRPRMSFEGTLEMFRHIQDHRDYFRMLMDTAWKADIAVLHCCAKRKRRPARTAAARRKDAREKRD